MLFNAGIRSTDHSASSITVVLRIYLFGLFQLIYMYVYIPKFTVFPYLSSTKIYRIILIYPISRLTINEFNEFMRQQIVLTRRFTVFSHLPYFHIYRVPRFTVFPDLLYTRFTALAHTQVYRII